MAVTDSMPRANILLVDDHPAKLLSYEVVLADLGENLIKATSAREALECLLRTDVAVILVDVCMPELDGFEFVALVREHPRYQRTAIIFVSAVQITDLDRVRGYEAGAVDYVPVPVVPEVLRAKVKVFLDLYRANRQLEELNRELEARVSQRTAELEAAAAELQHLNQELEQRIEERTQEREHALAQLFEAQKLDTIGQLTGSVAHDFNNLLMAVLGSLELLRKRIPDDPRSLRLLDNAISGAQRGASLTQRLLAFARRQELRPEVVDVVALVTGMEDLLARALGPVVRVNRSFPDDLPQVRVDANQLELALLNISINARDAMPFGGSLLITASAESVGDGAKLKAGRYVRIRVADTGVGMDAATLAKAAEPFFTTKGPGKGTGLGLSMAQGLAAQSGGALTLASTPGEGTTVEIWLPQVESSAAAAPRSGAVAPRTTVGTRSCRILLVDDDPLVMTGTSAMLEELGHHVTEFSSATAALDHLRAGGPADLVITDHAMPGMSGAQLARTLAAEFPGLPVVLATGYAEISDENQALCPHRLSKPFRFDELAQVLATVLGSDTEPANVVALGRGPRSALPH